ncbi:ABC transporter substrate-binding protein [Rhodococcus sp. HNM0569]|uniref:ABC transporter substrate-binding protein n=1 Tax=Rhodococcus sp. HNM0569 TaxID=2716340 RepID=UPI00146C399E|nr:ABC transporter substrate-binding protein [Rhodococcus sp. HNM0569]NLU82217.1 ABC transporter substrate-binding protein [Rhodococcus sp. HNM0569]
MQKTRFAAAALLAGSALVLASCSGASSGASAADGELEKTEVTVGVLPLADYAAVYWADEHGLFEKEGLKVTLEPIQGGPIGIQKVASGELDFAIANSISSSISQAQGAPVTNVAHTASLGEGSGMVFVDPDSPIRTIDDLDGKTLGTNTTRNIGDVTFNNLAKSEGKDVAPNFIEVPFPEMVAGVQAGSIEAGYAPEPFSSAARAAGMRQVADVTTGPNAHLAASVFVAGDKFVDANPDTTAAFARAIYAAGGEITDSEAEFRSWLPGVAKVPDEVAQSMVLPVFASSLDLTGLEAVAAMLKEQGLVPDDFDIAEHTFTTPED